MYKWENEISDVAVLENLTKEQKSYEKEHQHNDCEYCGKNNQGSPVELSEGKYILMHYGLWKDDTCLKCGVES